MKKEKTIIKTILIILLANLWVYFSFASAWNLSCNSMGLLLSADLTKLSELWSVKLISQNFCEHVHNSKCEDNIDAHDSDYFDANQSIFLTLLCDNVGKGQNFTFINRTENDSILKKRAFSDFNIYNYNMEDINYCDSKTNMNWCDFPKHLPKMFNEIINDYFNIWQARIYGIKWFQEKINPIISANEFSDENFLIKICDPSNKQYYTKSCKYLSNYMKKANQLLIKTKVVDVKKLTEQNKNFDCDNKFSENILYCGLLGSDNNLSDNFLNLIYNEYLWYRLFMEYYSTNLSTNPDLSNLISNSNAEKLKDNKEKIIWLQQNNTKIKKALSDSLRTLSEIAQTFPLHIWFTMYQENANIFMKELSKIYPPIRTLADKLKNVQKTD